MSEEDINYETKYKYEENDNKYDYYESVIFNRFKVGNEEVDYNSYQVSELHIDISKNGSLSFDEWIDHYVILEGEQLEKLLDIVKLAIEVRDSNTKETRGK
jgi:hypothetical protein